MLAAPVVGGEAEVEIAERTGDRDRAQRRLALERLDLGFELAEHAVDLLDLALAPVGPALVLGPECRLVARQQRGIEQPVGHRLVAQRHPAFAALAPQELAALVLAVEVFADHRRVEEVDALDRQHRDLADWIVLVDVGIGRDRRQRHVNHLDLLVELGLQRHHPDLSGVGRTRRVVELHLRHLGLLSVRPHARPVWGISVSLRRTLRATSISCCQVVPSIGTPFFSRSTLRARSGSPGASTSGTPACGLADFTQVMEASTSSSNISVPPLEAASMMIDSMLLMKSMPSLLL